jgi:hypothetical protein
MRIAGLPGRTLQLNPGVRHDPRSFADVPAPDPRTADAGSRPARSAAARSLPRAADSNSRATARDTRCSADRRSAARTRPGAAVTACVGGASHVSVGFVKPPGWGIWMARAGCRAAVSQCCSFAWKRLCCRANVPKTNRTGGHHADTQRSPFHARPDTVSR